MHAYLYWQLLCVLVHVFTQLTSDESWLPKSTSGRLAMDETFLGPFLAISGLMNDSKDLWEHYMENVSRDADYDSISNTIQQRLSICRVCVSDNLVHCLYM